MSLDVSPDGREIAFDLLGDLYVIPIDGRRGARHLDRPCLGHAAALFARRAARSPSPPTAAAATISGPSAATARAPRQITKEDFRLLNQADWTPDGNFIVARKHFTSARSLGAGEMWLYHRTGGGKGAASR